MSSSQSISILTSIFSKTFLEAAEFRRKAQAVQREMPRPSDVNTTVLRPKEIKADLNSLQLVKIFISRFQVKFELIY